MNILVFCIKCGVSFASERQRSAVIYVESYFVVDVLRSVRRHSEQRTDGALKMAFIAARRQQTDETRQHLAPRRPARHTRDLTPAHTGRPT